MGHPIACGKSYCSEQRLLFHSLGEEMFSVAFHLSNNFVSDTVDVIKFQLKKSRYKYVGSIA